MNLHFLSLFVPTFGLVCLTVVVIQLAVVWIWKRFMDVAQPPQSIVTPPSRGEVSGNAVGCGDRLLERG